MKSLGLTACTLGYRVRYRTSSKLLQEFTAAMADGSLDRKLNRYARYDLLLIDEFGFDRLEREVNARASSFYYRLLEARTGRYSTALATNIDFSEWGKYLGDPQLAMAFLDRLVDGAVILKLSGRSYRAHRADLHRRPVRLIEPEGARRGDDATRSTTSAASNSTSRPLPGSQEGILTPPSVPPQTIRAATGQVVPTGPK